MKSEAERLAVEWGVPVSITLMAVAARLLMTAERLTLLGFVRIVVIGGIVGYVTYLYVSGLPGLSEGEQGAILFGAGLLANDLVSGLIRIGGHISRDPLGLIAIILRAKK